MRGARVRRPSNRCLTSFPPPQLDPLGETTRQPAVAEMITYAEERDREHALFANDVLSPAPVRRLRRDGTEG